MLCRLFLLYTSLLVLRFSFPFSSKFNNKGQTRVKSIMVASPRVEIEYCTGCRWMLRSAWLAQELLTTFESEIGEVALIPSRTGTGNFIIRIGDELIWNRKNPDTPGFPEAKILKQKIRDIISPVKDLGHSDKPRVTDISDPN